MKLSRGSGACSRMGVRRKSRGANRREVARVGANGAPMVTVEPSVVGAASGRRVRRGYRSGMTKLDDGWVTIPYDGAARRAVPVLVDGWKRRCTIYALVARKKPEIIRYVGRTMHPDSRFDGHLRTNVGRLKAWIVELDANGDTAIMVQLERCRSRDAWERENYWYRFYREMGMADLNTGRPSR